MASEFKNAIDASTRFCAVYGHPIHHSASPAFQNAGMAALGLNWRYLAFDVPPDRLQEAIRGAAAMRFIGLNLTVPHKVLAVDSVDTLDESARTWGAVNTIRFEARDASGEWTPLRDLRPEAIESVRAHGFNTDADAIVDSIAEELQLRPQGCRIVILGTGGVGRVAALKLAAEGAASLWLVNRTASKAESLAEEIRRLYPGTHVSVGYPDGPVDLTINATSLGLSPDDPLPIDTAKLSLKQCGSVFDMIYRPAETPLLSAAREAGCPTANGIGMLLHQGVSALRIWTGREPPVEIMREALKRTVYGI